MSFRLHPLPKAARTLVVETDGAAAVAAGLLGSQLQPSALDVLHPGRVAVLFEGSERAVAAQLAAARSLFGGDEDDGRVWDESRERQGASMGRLRFVPGELAETLAARDVHSPTLSAAATVGSTSAGSRNGAKGAQNTPSG